MSTSQGAKRKVILYELNEVPWEILDLYTAAKPGSTLKRVLDGARNETTVNKDSVGLQPWRTWPTFHKGLYSADHKSLDLGQDPGTFEGDNIWDVAEANGLKIGVFGPLQSWPAHEPRNGGFYVPDTFSRDSKVYPESLERFQAFNLRMTQENSFSSNVALDFKQIALTGVNVATQGLTPWSAAFTARHLVRERRDARFKACRSMIQALPTFDLYWRLHKRKKPDLSIFFTNHVASMMHRYWGDAVPGYSEQYGYEPDPVFQQFLFDSLDIVDHHLDRILKYVKRHPETVLMIAASMGQAPIEYTDVRATYVLKDPVKFLSGIGAAPGEPGLAMHPKTSIEFSATDAAEAAAAAVNSVRCAGGEMFAESETRVAGTTLSFAVRSEADSDTLDPNITYEKVGAAGTVIEGQIGDLGIAAEDRLGGGNTAYHIPQGILITYGEGVEPDASRRDVEVLEMAPTILGLLGVAADRSAVTA